MKNLLLATLLTFFLGSTNKIVAQFVVSVNVVDCSSPAVCDGSAAIDSTNTLPLTTIAWYMNGVLLQNGGTSISNLCPGNYSLIAMGGGLTLTSPFTIGVSTPNPCASLGMYVTETMASSQNVCDGSLTVNAYGGTPPYAYQMPNMPMTGGPTFNNLCIGTYNLTVVDANGCTLSQAANVYYDTTSTSPCAGFSPTVTVTDCSAPGACDGAIAISCGTCAPFTVLWSQGSTTNSIFNLCEGYYDAVVTDNNGCTFNTSQFVAYNGSGNIDSINVIGNLATGGLISGTLMSSWVYNCDIDMSMLDTAYMVSASFGNNPANQDSLYTVWYLADTTGAFTYINYAFYAPFNSGTYNLVLQVYCPIKSNPIYYNIITQLNLQSAGLTTNTATSLLLSPNPVQDLLNITGNVTGAYQIYNAAGQCLQSGTVNKQLDVRQLANGNYFLHLNGQVLPFVKMHQ
ncbi:MAG: T9SS type A sorting domain-containing protein [Flavobacteriales bacterium]